MATSSNSEQHKQNVILLLDRTHQSKVTVRLLSDLGISVEAHKRHYLPDAPDPDWIADSTAKGWVIISGDKGIEYDGVNRQAVVKAGAKVFLLTDTESRGTEWAASLVMARNRIIRIANENKGPFYCTIEKGNDHHVRGLRFLEGGGPMKTLQDRDTEQTAEEKRPAERAVAPGTLQTELFVATKSRSSVGGEKL